MYNTAPDLDTADEKLPEVSPYHTLHRLKEKNGPICATEIVIMVLRKTSKEIKCTVGGISERTKMYT